jgi:glycosyltransferase involved in cell wall biosynthesis
MGEDKKIKIILVEQRGGGGMIHYAYQLCTALSKEGADITLVTSIHYELDNLPHNFMVNKLMRLWPQIDPQTYTLPKSVFGKLLRKLFWNARRVFRGVKLIIEWLRLTRFLVRAQPNVVQVGGLETTVEILFLLYWRYKGLVVSQICHEFEERDAGKNLMVRLNQALNQYLYKSLPVVFLHGEVNKEKFLALFDARPDSVHSIEHGNEQIFHKAGNVQEIKKNLEEKYNLHATSKVILFFGNLTPSKGIPDLIQAFEYVYKNNQNAKLVIAGMPSKYIDVNDFINLANKLGLGGSIIFDNRYIPMEEIEPLMELAQVVVLPYRTISQSGALQVAYAFGKPVVATRTGGFVEAVEDGKSGFLVPVESPKELGQAIIKILGDDSLARQMGEYAKYLSETRFAWEPIARKILGVYRSML